ncbi:MAG: NAD(P)/FAD-dependent oxidoreductase [Rhodobacteraceae bacterium]|nr:NAD(P)/FAD-dependent oxidoreductase [Paracoccaceae bacterium]
MASDRMGNCTVAIVGGGPAGLALATELKARGVGNVVVLEREATAGGVPRHCGHYPFGVWEFKRLMKGPDYARALVQKAKNAGVEIRTGCTVTALHPNARLSLSTATGVMELQAERVVLCTGVRESSRAQRFIGGARPQGVISTGALQSMVYLQQMRPFRRPVIIGTELVSFSAIMTCRHRAMRPVAMIEQNNRITVRQFMRPFPAVMGVPVKLGASKLRVLGQRLVEGIEYLDRDQNPQTIDCDGVIVSGNFRPEAALLHASHIDVDPGTGGPSVDQYGRTSDPSYFCTGNLLRPVETSGWCWQEAVECARRVADDLTLPIGNPGFVALQTQDPAIRFVLPQRLTLSDAPGAMANMQLRLSQPAIGHLTACSASRTLWGDFLQSRPERRILAPLAPMLKAGVTAPVDLSIIRSN